jgi:hypothetical protein
VSLGKLFKSIDHFFSCGDKVKYGHQETADKACESMKAKYGTELESYKCRHCEGWHIGHKR